MMIYDKTQVLRHMINFYASDMISPNIDIHMLFYKCMQDIVAARTDTVIKDVYIYIRFIRNHNIIEKCQDIDRTSMPNTDVLQRISFSDEALKLQTLREYLHEDVLKLVHFVYICLQHQTDFHDMIAIVNYLLAMKQRDIFKTSTKSDICNILFSFMAHVVTGNDVLLKYVKISKELYYFKSTKSHSMEHRLGILYTTLQVVYHRFIDDRVVNKPEKSLDTKAKYLFVICERDEETIQEVRRDKKKSYIAKLTVPKKNILVSDSICPKKDAPEIVKL